MPNPQGRAALTGLGIFRSYPEVAHQHTSSQQPGLDPPWTLNPRLKSSVALRSLGAPVLGDDLYYPGQVSSLFKNNCFTEMCSGSEEGSSLRLIDLCITQL